MRNRIKSRELGQGHTLYDLTDSTMNDMNAYIAEAIANGDDIHGHVIQALQQTNGRGSTDIKTGLTRAWTSNEGNLLFSMAVSIKELHHREIYLLGALAVYDAIRSLDLSYDDLAMKIPNDIYIDGKKICGVLTHDDFCFGEWCNMGIGVNTAFAPEVTDGRNVAGCLRDFGAPLDQKPENFLRLFQEQFEFHFETQLHDPFHVFKAFDLINDDGLIYAYNKDNPHQWAVGAYKGFETEENGDDYLLIEDADKQTHRFLFLRTEIQNPDTVLNYYAPICALKQNVNYE
jgi:BirA family biotin operon repressor/biotin-[acetyl-CoA-carboxylase] ligase